MPPMHTVPLFWGNSFSDTILSAANVHCSSGNAHFPYMSAGHLFFFFFLTVGNYFPSLLLTGRCRQNLDPRHISLGRREGLSPVAPPVLLTLSCMGTLPPGYPKQILSSLLPTCFLDMPGHCMNSGVPQALALSFSVTAPRRGREPFSPAPSAWPAWLPLGPGDPGSPGTLLSRLCLPDPALGRSIYP